MDRNRELAKLYKYTGSKEFFNSDKKDSTERKVEGDWYLFEPPTENDFAFIEQPYIAGMLKELILDEGQDPLEFMKEKGWKITKVSVYREE